MSLKKSHILILSKWYPNPADPQLGIFVQNQAQLISKTFDVSVIYVQGVPDCSEPYLVKTIDNFGVKEIRIYFKQAILFRKLLHFFKYRKAQKIGLKLLSKQIDLVHVHVPIRPAILALELLKKKKIPFIVTEHWSGHLNGQFKNKSFFYKKYYENVLSKAAKVTAVSQSLSEKLSEFFKIELSIIPNFISISNETPIKTMSDQTQIISVSDLNNDTKNITGLLSGFKQALLENEKLHLTIIGDGPDKQLIIDKIKQLSLENNVTLLGRKTQPEVLKLITKFHFYVCNSNVETFGMTVAEAIATGLPVICTRCGGPESFVNSENGILIPPKNDTALYKAILEMNQIYPTFDNNQMRDTITKKFGERAILNQWHQLYQSILDE